MYLYRSMIINLAFWLTTILAVTGLEDPDLIRNCGDAKALALGLPPSKGPSFSIETPSAINAYVQPQVQIQSLALTQPQVHVQPQLNLQQLAYDKFKLYQPTAQLQQVELAYAAPKKLEQGYAVTAGLSSYAFQPKYAVDIKTSPLITSPAIVSSYADSSLSSSHLTDAHSSLLYSTAESDAASKLSSVVASKSIPLSYPAQYSYGAAYPALNLAPVTVSSIPAAPIAPIPAVKAAPAVQTIVAPTSVKAIPSVQTVTPLVATSPVKYASAVKYSASDAYSQHLASSAGQVASVLAQKVPFTPLPAVSKYSLASDVSTTNNLYAASLKPVAALSYAAPTIYSAPIVQKPSRLSLDSATKYTLASDIASSYLASQQRAKSDSSNLYSASIKSSAPAVYSTGTIYSAPVASNYLASQQKAESGSSNLYSASIKSSAPAVYSTATIYSAPAASSYLASQQRAKSDSSNFYSASIKSSAPALYSTDGIYSAPVVQKYSSLPQAGVVSKYSSAADVSSSYLSSHIQKSNSALNVPASLVYTSPTALSTSAVHKSANLDSSGAVSKYSSASEISSSLESAKLSSLNLLSSAAKSSGSVYSNVGAAYVAPVIQKSSRVEVSHGDSSSYAYSTGNVGQVEAVGVKNLAVAPAASAVKITPAVKYTSAPSVSSSYVGTIAIGHNQGTGATPASYATAGPAVKVVAAGKEGKHVAVKQDGYYNAHPNYFFEYYVNDPNTGDIKEQREQRDGDVVNGHYSLVEPDGNVRTVSYKADWETGFHAKVSNSKESSKA